VKLFRAFRVVRGRHATSGIQLLVLASLLLGACASKQPIIPEPLVSPRAETHPEDLEQNLVAHGVDNTGLTLSTSIHDTPQPVSYTHLTLPTIYSV